MELIYLWVGNYRNIHKTGFTFSRKYNVDFYNIDTNSSEIRIHENDIEPNLFEHKIDEITAIIGKNGSGKTNILDLLGAKRDDRHRLGAFENLSYFIIYHLEGNKFAIEGSDFDYIRNSISEFSNEETTNHITEPYSIIVEKGKEKFSFKGFLQFQDEPFRDCLNLFNYRHQYSGEAFQHFGSMTIENEHSHLFNRINLNRKNTGYAAIYQMINDLNKKDVSQEESKFMFTFQNNIYLKIRLSMHRNDDIKLELKKGFEDKFDILRLNQPELRIKFSEKKDFINYLLYNYCHSLASQFIKLPEMDADLSKIIGTLRELDIHNDNYQYYYFEVIDAILSFQVRNDKFFSNKNKEQVIEIINKFVNQIQKFSPAWFNREDITIPLVDNNLCVNDFLNLFDSLLFVDDELQSLTKVFAIKFYPFSAGEEALMSLFAALHHGLKLKYNQSKEKAIILLDEPDNFMHPEWSRLLIKELCTFLNRLEEGYKSYQLIITTHSPFIISDLPKCNVIGLDLDHTGKCIKVPIEKSFAANIHTLLAQDFFMTSTIGEFAKYKINGVIKLLNSSTQGLSIEEMEEVDYIISLIDEPLIKSKLIVMAEKFKDKEETIKQLQARIMELKNDTYKKQ